MKHPAVGLLTIAAATLACGAIPVRAPVQPTPRPALVLNEPRGGFSIEVPGDWQRLDDGDYPIVFSQPATPGTNLLEKRMEFDVRDTSAACGQAAYGGASSTTERVQINGVEFLRETGEGIAAGNVFEWTSYTTSRGWVCITITFVLHASGSGVYATEPPAFDRLAESAIFDQLISTFQFKQ
jgi:hypothetical protein